MRCEGKIGEYDIIGRIGAGSYGIVCKGKIQGMNDIYAIKQMEVYGKSGLLDAPLIETSVLQNLDHPNIVKPVGFLMKKNVVYMIMPYLGPSLDKRILPKTLARDVMYQLLLAVLHMQCNDVIHRDIKPANIVMDIGSHIPVVVDFGIASQKGVGTTDVNVVSMWWRMPELFRDIEYDNRVDVWSLGVVMFNILTGLNLFGGTTPSSYLSNVLSAYPDGREWYEKRRDILFDDVKNLNIKDGPLLAEILYDRGLDEDEISLIQYILQLDYDNIPSPIDCINHKYFDAIREPVIPVIVRPAYPYPMIVPYNNKVRMILTKWLVNVNKKFQFGDLTLYTTITLFDNFQKELMNGRMGTPVADSMITAGNRMPKDEIQIIAYACFYLSAMMTQSPPYDEKSIATFLYDEARGKLLPYSIFVYQTLGYNLMCYTPHLGSEQYKESLLDGSILSQ